MRKKYLGIILCLGMILFDLYNKTYGATEKPFLIRSLSKDPKPMMLYGKRIQKDDLSYPGTLYISYEVFPQDSLNEEIIDKIISANKKGVNILLTLESEGQIDQNFVGLIRKLSGTGTEIWLSLIPKETISQDVYHKLYSNIKKKLEGKKIHIVWYPKSNVNMDSIPIKDIEWAGVCIKTKKDMKTLEMLHKKLNTKYILVNEYIMDNYKQDIKYGIDAINDLYYSAAAKYPKIKMIYNNSISMGDNTKYQKAYTDILGEPWITSDIVYSKLVATEAYKILEDSSKVEGTISLILDTKPEEDIGYVEYKWNNENLTQAIMKPYLISVNTNTLHNGINRLAIIRYDTKGKMLDKRQIDLKINNNNIVKRASRKGTQYKVDQKSEYTKPYIPVLMYHKIEQKVQKGDQSMSVERERFEDQIKQLLNSGYTPITFYDLQRYLKGTGGLPKKPVIITADDGYMNNYTLAYPILKKYNAQATFFVTTQFVGEKTSSDHFSWEQAKEMEQSGLIDIQAHTHGHAILNRLSDAEIQYQVSMCFGVIEKKLGKRDVKVLSYPEFRNNLRTRKSAKKAGADMQVTDLAIPGSITTEENIQRIHVTNYMSGKDLVDKIVSLTN